MAGETTVGGIKVKITGDTTSLDSALTKTRTGLNQVGKYAAVASAAMVAAGAVMVTAQLKVLDALGKTADALGIQQEKLQALQHVAELTGTSSEAFNKALERMEKNLGNAARIGGTASDALEDIGINVNEILKLSPDEQIEQLAVALSSVESQSIKASIANDLFGRSGVKMLKMMEALKDDGLKPTEEALEAMGITLSRVDTSKVEQANDAMFKVSETVTGLVNKMTVKLAPILEEVSNQLIVAATESDGFGESVDSAFDGAITVINTFADGLHGIQIIFKTLEVAVIGFSALAVNVLMGVATTVTGVVDMMSDKVNWLIELINEQAKFDTGLTEIPSINDSSFMQGLSDVSANMIGLVEQTNLELHNLAMQELPSEQIDAFVAKAEEASTKIAVALTGGSGEENTEDEQEFVGLNVDQDALSEDIETFMTAQDEISAIEKDAADARVTLAQTEATAKKSAQQGFFSDLSSLMNSGSKKAFQIGKVAALAQAGISGVSSAITA